MATEQTQHQRAMTRRSVTFDAVNVCSMHIAERQTHQKQHPGERRAKPCVVAYSTSPAWERAVTEWKDAKVAFVLESYHSMLGTRVHVLVRPHIEGICSASRPMMWRENEDIAQGTRVVVGGRSRKRVAGKVSWEGRCSDGAPQSVRAAARVG